MNINILDVVLVLLVVVCVLAGYFRGLFRSVISFAKYAVGIPLAFFFADKYSTQIYNSLFREAALKKVTDSIEQTANIDSVVSSVKESVSSFPFGLSGIVDLSFLDNINNSTAAQAVTENVLDPVLLVVVKATVFLLVLLAVAIISFLISRIVKKLEEKDRVPFKHTNKFMGALLGAFKGVVLLAGVCAALVFMRDFVFASSQNEFVRLVDTSSVTEFINKINPLIKLV